MTPSNHPPDVLLTASAAGTLDLGWHIAVATHVHGCARCRTWIRMAETVGGAVLENLLPAAMSQGALRTVEARIDGTFAAAPSAQEHAAGLLADIPGLPAFVRDYPAGNWRWVAPGIDLLPIYPPAADDARVFLLKARAGLKLLPHTHSGTEMTCVLTGSFSHDGGQFSPADFDLGDADVDHIISIGEDTDCICLVAMSGELRLKGFIGSLMQRFVSI